MSQTKERSRKSCRELVKEIYKGDRRKVRNLLLKGANVNHADYNGNTLLHHAVASRDIEIVRLIIEHGADINAMNDFHFRPYNLAYNNKFIEALELLLKNNAVIFNVDVLFSNLPRRVIDLIYDRIDVQVRNARGLTALHIATANNDVSAVRRLLDRGADSTVTTLYNGESPLHLVISYEIAKLLLDHGALINAPDRNLCTPLYGIAVKNRNGLTIDEQSRIIGLFIDRGASVFNVFVAAELRLDYNGGFDRMYGLKDVLKFIGLREDEQNFRERINRGNFRSDFSIFYQRILAEVINMKLTKFYCNVSFYEFLVKSWQRRTNYIDNRRVANIVDTVNNDLTEMFPLYSAILKRYIDTAYKRNELRENSAIALTVACPHFRSTQLIVDVILTFLNEKDMKFIVEAYDDFQPNKC